MVARLLDYRARLIFAWSPHVIVILKSNVTQQQLDDVVHRIEELGVRADLRQGTFRTIIGIIGDEQKLRSEPWKAIPGVEDVVPLMLACKLASLDADPQPSVIDVAGVKIGGGHLAMIAGPCAVGELPFRLRGVTA